MLVFKISSLTCVHTLTNNTNINTKYSFQNSHSYVNIPSTTTQHNTQLPIAKIHIFTCLQTHYNKTKRTSKYRCLNTSLTCVHTLYNNKNTNTIDNCEHKNWFSQCPVLFISIPSTTTQKLTQNIVAKITSLTCVHTLY